MFVNKFSASLLSFSLMDSSTDQLAEYKEKLSKEAENLLTNIIPGRVKELEALLESPELSVANPERVVDDLKGSKVFVLPGGIVKTNPTITELLRVVKPHL